MSRAVSPVVGSLLLITITVAIAAVLAATVGSAALGGVGAAGEATDFTRFTVAAETDGTVTLTHDGGDPVDVRDLSLTVAVDGTELREQPPVPFFSSAGFEPGPTGPFNSASDPTWRAGGTASFTISESNAPIPTAGDELTVTIRRDGRRLGQVSAAVSGADSG